MKHAHPYLLLSIPPELVITDVNMPIVSGLELIGKISAMPHLTEFIIISGFDDFQYAKQAMSFGVRNYILTSQFYKVFKKITGMNPSEFRDMIPK